MAIEFRNQKRWFVGSVQFYFKHEHENLGVQFLAFVKVMNQHTTAEHDKAVPLVKQSSHHIKYAVIHVNDIDQQVGLVQCPNYNNQFYVIAPYYVFNSNLDISAGNLSLI